MKKVLSLLGSLGLVATTASVVVSCQTKMKTTDLEKYAALMKDRTIQVLGKDLPLSPEKFKKSIIQQIQIFCHEKGLNSEIYIPFDNLKAFSVNGSEIIKNGKFVVAEDKDLDKDKLFKPTEGKTVPVVVLIQDVTFEFNLEVVFEEN